MHIVGFAAIVTITSTFVGTDTDALVEPSEAFRHVALVIQHLLDMGLHIVNALHRETASEDFKVVVITFQLTKPIVGTASVHRMRCEVGIVANKEYELKIVCRVIVDVSDVILDLVVVVAACF